MRQDKPIVFVDMSGEGHGAAVAAVAGTGDSGRKILHVIVGAGRFVADVPHARDAGPGAAYWREEGAQDTPPPPEPKQAENRQEKTGKRKAKAKQAK